ncbi:proline dehydrogenase family protein [Rhizohabitans arisaemae]|uniref:proline dehydrogenase family protein n=1 Tax=Rhizohabitans arisaemae TaxID=2720610 RepID=UPI0024B1226C|nr:proline dehydrogenase family protein [Rhizohabitans arisaemae]
MLASILLRASRSAAARRLIAGSPLTRRVVDRFVAGEELDEVVDVVGRLAGAGMDVTIDVLGEDTLDLPQAEAIRDAYLALIERLEPGSEVSLKLSALGQALPGDGEKIALEHAHQICRAAAARNILVTLDMEDHTTIDSTLSILHTLRAEFPWVGVALQAYLYRTEEDCRELSRAGSRVRLVKGAYKEPPSVAIQSKAGVDRAYIRCMKILMAGAGRPMIATHDERMIEVAKHLAMITYGRTPDSYEFQMLYGIRAKTQRRLVDEGSAVRVYVPFGQDWYGYFMRRLAERPANVAFFLRSLISR